MTFGFFSTAIDKQPIQGFGNGRICLLAIFFFLSVCTFRILTLSSSDLSNVAVLYPIRLIIPFPPPVFVFLEANGLFPALVTLHLMEERRVRWLLTRVEPSSNAGQSFRKEQAMSYLALLIYWRVYACRRMNMHDDPKGHANEWIFTLNL